MSNYPPNQNPFSAPQPYNQGGPYQPYGQQPMQPFNQTKVTIPAIFLIIVSSLGLLFSLYGVYMSFQPPAPVDLQQPVFVQKMQEGQHGASATVLQTMFTLLNMTVIVGAVYMIQLKNWGLALTASILTMVNIGNCCCLIGLPFGIWSLVILLQGDVKQAFDRNG